MLSKASRITPRAIFVIAISLPTFALVINYSSAAIDSVKSALSLCAKNVIPSLFPFMVISELAVSLGAANHLGKMFSPLFRPLFNINSQGAAAFMLGSLCGFPVGARSAVAFYEQGKLTDKQLTHVLCFCNNPSSAFVISAIGISLFNSKALGIALYIITLLSALMIGFSMRFIYGNKSHNENAQAEKKVKSAAPKGAAIFTKAVTDSANAMLAICAFIVFFSALLGTFEAAAKQFNTPPQISAPIACFFELTNGVTYVSSHLSGEGALALCAFAVGWSGLSVHFQIMAICKDCKISFRPYFFAKAIQGLLNSLLMLAYLRIFKPRLFIDTGADAPIFYQAPEIISILSLIFFVIGVIAIIIKKVTKSDSKKRNFF